MAVVMDKGRIAALLDALGQGIFEKGHVLSLALLAAVAGESVFLLGSSGDWQEHAGAADEACLSQRQVIRISYVAFQHAR